MTLPSRATLHLCAALALLLVPACEYEAHSGIRGGEVTSAFPPQDGGTPVDPFSDAGRGSPPMSDGGTPSSNDAGRPHTLDAGRRPGTSIDGGSDAGPPPPPPPPPTDAGTDAGITPPPPPPPPPPTNCPLAGSWRLDQVLCGGADYTSSFLRPGIVARLIFSERPSGGCFLAFELAGASCREYEEGHMTGVGTSWTMESYGVTSCSPPGCRYGSWDTTSCTIGAGRGTYSADFSIDSSGTRLTDTRVTSEVACASVGRLPQVATWIRE